MLFITFYKKPKLPKEILSTAKLSRMLRSERLHLQRTEKIRKQFNSTARANELIQKIRESEKTAKNLLARKPEKRGLELEKRLKTVYLENVQSTLFYLKGLKAFSKKRRAHPKFVTLVESLIKAAEANLEKIKKMTS